MENKTGKRIAALVESIAIMAAIWLFLGIVPIMTSGLIDGIVESYQINPGFTVCMFALGVSLTVFFVYALYNVPSGDFD